MASPPLFEHPEHELKHDRLDVRRIASVVLGYRRPVEDDDCRSSRSAAILLAFCWAIRRAAIWWKSGADRRCKADKSKNQRLHRCSFSRFSGMLGPESPTGRCIGSLIWSCGAGSVVPCDALSHCWLQSQLRQSSL